MIVAAAACPCPPLLARELTGQQEVLPELRSACAQAVGWLAGVRPDLLVVVGPDEETAVWPANGRLDLAAYAPALATGRTGPGLATWRAGPALATGRAGPGLATARTGPSDAWSAAPGRAGPGAAAAERPLLPLALGIGARLLDEAGYTGPRALHGIAAGAAPGDCATLGTRIAARAPRVALLVMGDGTARRGASAPGYLDERAEPFDASVERAFRHGDLGALAALDPGLAADLLAVGRPAWQVLAGALTARIAGAPATPDVPGGGANAAGHDHYANPAAALVTRVLYADAPLGVAYLVATLEPGDASR